MGRLFTEVERFALQPLPAMVFPVFEEARRTVHRDGHVEFKRAYYSVPPEYVDATVWVRQETRLLAKPCAALPALIWRRKACPTPPRS